MEIWLGALKEMRAIREENSKAPTAHFFVYANELKDVKDAGEALHTLGPRAELEWIQALAVEILSSEKLSSSWKFFLLCSIVLHSSLRTEILKEYIEEVFTSHVELI